MSVLSLFTFWQQATLHFYFLFRFCFSCCVVRRNAFSICWSTKPLSCWVTPEVLPPSTWLQPVATRRGSASCSASPVLNCPRCHRWETTKDTHRCIGPVTMVMVSLTLSSSLLICVSTFCRSLTCSFSVPTQSVRAVKRPPTVEVSRPCFHLHF